MAGTVTQTYYEVGHVRKVVIEWVADASAATVPATALTTKIQGQLLRMVTNPGATAPTADYDITLVGDEGEDVLQGVGIDRHTSTTEDVAIVFSGTAVHPWVSIADTLTFTLANNSVNSALGTATIYYGMV